MSCNAFYRLLRRAEGLLPTALQSHWERHARDCAACRAWRNRQERLGGLLRRSLVEDAEEHALAASPRPWPAAAARSTAPRGFRFLPSLAGVGLGLAALVGF